MVRQPAASSGREVIREGESNKINKMALRELRPISMSRMDSMIQSILIGMLFEEIFKL